MSEPAQVPTDERTSAGTEGVASNRLARAWWARPQVLAATIVLLGSAWFAWWARPSEPPPPPDLDSGGATITPTTSREVTLYRVVDGVANPIPRAVPAAQDDSARIQAVVDALRDVLVEAGDWPDALPAPSLYALRIERDDAVVLDLPRHDALVDVAAERTILASIERTLAEQGIDRIAYLVDGRARAAWLGNLDTASTLE